MDGMKVTDIILDMLPVSPRCSFLLRTVLIGISIGTVVSRRNILSCGSERKQSATDMREDAGEGLYCRGMARLATKIFPDREADAGWFTCRF
jgi:hypothetical protein